MHAYNLRSRVDGPSSRGSPGAVLTPPTKATFNQSKSQQGLTVLQLDHVIGTTTKNPGGLSSCPTNNTFAYCAGSIAVLARVDDTGQVSRQHYRARPAAIPLNPSSSYYVTPTTTPTRKHRSFATPRKEHENVTPARLPLEDQNAATWTARERIKAITCVSLSPAGRLLAVGETGYNPRVLLFSTSAEMSTETPLSVVGEHTWGVKAVAFSPDSRYLATLGEANDGFLFIWSVNQRTGAVKLCATNKCTSNVCHMVWCGQRLVTVGTRHIKVWTLPDSERASPSKTSRLQSVLEPSSSSSPSALRGRNCLLGAMADMTFICATSISEHLLLVSTDVGSLAMVDVSKIPAELVALDHDQCLAGAVAFRQGPRRLVWAGGGGEINELDVDHLIKQQSSSPTSSRPDPSRSESGTCVPRRSLLGLSQHIGGTIAISSLTKHTICINNDSTLQLWLSGTGKHLRAHEPLMSHHGPVSGVQALGSEYGPGAFFTWSKSGEVRIWNSEAQLLRVAHIELDEGSESTFDTSNELKMLKSTANGGFLSGDRFGMLKLISSDSWQLQHTIRAHGAEITDICLDGTAQYVATCSRDRMVQVFRLHEASLDLLQTTDDHIAAVNQVTFSLDGNILLSCSSDRTIVVREKVTRQHGDDSLVAFLQTRIITIKSAPLCMCLAIEKTGILYVSALDRQITKIDFITGTVLDSFKVGDSDTNDHAVLNSIQVASRPEIGGVRDLLVGCSSTDKSVRVYDLQKQKLLSKESAHTEGVSDLSIVGGFVAPGVPNRLSFVSTGLDSTIMIWAIASSIPALSITQAIELTQEQTCLSNGSDLTPTKSSSATLPPLRKVLTKLDIAEFVRSPSPHAPLLRDSSPAHGPRRKGSKLNLVSSTIAEADETTSPALRRRASADDRAKSERRSPSPPAYATRRQKKLSTRGEVTKDFFTRQSEWLRRSPSPQDTPTTKQEPRTNKTRLRRPPSVPTDLRGKAVVQERRMSTVTTPSEPRSVNLATEQACRTLKAYKQKLQASDEDLNLDDIEAALSSALDLVKRKKQDKTTGIQEMPKNVMSTAPALRRGITWTPTTRSPKGQQSSSSDATSPSWDANVSSDSNTEEKQEQKMLKHSDVGPGVDGLAILMERTNLAEV